MKWLACLFFSVTIAVSAQTPVPLEVHRFEGLPTSVIYNIIQDGQHFIWLGTEKGLVRYDGKRFVTYTNAQMRGVAVSDLRFDKHKQLHCQNFSGQHFVMKGDSLHIDTSLAVTGNYAPVLMTENGNLYQLAYKTVYSSNGKRDTLFFQQEIYSLFQSGGDVFTFDADSIYTISSKRSALKIPFSLKDEVVYFFIRTGGQLLLFPRNTAAGVCYQFFPEFKVLNYSIPKVNIQTAKVIDDQIFIGTNNGLYVYANDLKPAFTTAPLLHNKSISDVYKDADGTVWVSTLDNGLYKYSCWNCITVQTEEAVSALHFNVSAKDVYMGTVGGKVMKWNQQPATQTLFESKTRQRITALYYDNANSNLLVAGDAFTIADKEGKNRNYRLAVKRILPIGDAQYLLPRTGGLTYLVKKENAPVSTKKVIYTQDDRWLFYENFMVNNANVRVKSAAYDSIAKTAYAATSIGLLSINTHKWNEVKDGVHSIVANDVKFHNDSLYVASNQGLIILKNDKIIHRWNASNSILPNAVKSVQILNGNVWTVSGSKIFSIQLSDNSIRSFSLTNEYEVNDFTMSDKQLFMATDAGVVVADLNKLSGGHHPLQLHLEHFKTDKQQLKTEGESTLRYDDNNLKLDFSVPYFGNTDDVTVLYKINEENWQAVEQGQRQLTFISLQPGDYKVQLKAMAAGGRASNIQAVSFYIRAPFWKTWWFYTLSLLLVAAVTYTVYRYRLKLVQDKSRLEQQKIELENKLRESILASVKAQMNPHFIFNALNTIQSFIYLNDKQNATSYLGKFSQLTRTILDMSNKSSVSLQEEIDAILLYLELEKMRFDEEMNFSIEVSSEINTSAIRIPSMLIQPYLENAVKHGLLHKKTDRVLKCIFEKQNNMLKVIVDDNGIGRVRSQELNKIKNKQYQSFATQANEKRLDALNRSNTDTLNVRYIDKVSSLGESLGTTVELLIALENE